MIRNGRMTLALVGNPNCGKTTLFNALTGSNQYVGNWPGVTVEQKTGTSVKGNFDVVDLPGLYSLSPYSIEEKVTRDFLAGGTPDVIINIIDGTNLERNLYLTVQLIEINKPMVVAVNMIDEVEQSGCKIDCGLLSELVGIPFVPISAKRGENIDTIFTEIDHVIAHNHIPPEINYDYNTQKALNRIFSAIVKPCRTDKLPYTFYAAKLLEGDTETPDILGLTQTQRDEVELAVSEYERTSEYGDREAMLADARYTFIEKLVAKTVVKPKTDDSPTISDKIDRIMTGKYTAIPAFLLIMLLMFTLTFGTVGSFLSECVEKLFGDVLSPAVSGAVADSGTPEWCESLLVDAVIGGVGGILTFLPQIAILFVCLSILEDSGYMARAAFITDRFLRKLGLSGKSFIPMIMGFGCTTPAVMATRTQENVGERRMTIMLIPYMSCGAKIPIYALFAGALFTSCQGLVVFSMYILGFVVAILTGLVLKRTIFKDNKAQFIMELPPYRMPSPVSVLRSSWDKVKGFIIKAGTVIFAMSVLIWFLQTFSTDFKMVEDSSQSIFASIGKLIAPIFRPLGFGSWKESVALLSGLVAKEAVVSTMGVLYSADGAELSGLIGTVFSPLSAYAFMAFSLLYIPCISAFTTIRRETASAKYAWGAALMQMLTAYVVALLIYQIGSFIGG